MKTTCLAACGLLACFSLTAMPRGSGMQSRESRIRIGNASLHARAIGSGPPLIVLHGGPDFDQAYFA